MVEYLGLEAEKAAGPPQAASGQSGEKPSKLQAAPPETQLRTEGAPETTQAEAPDLEGFSSPLLIWELFFDLLLVPKNPGQSHRWTGVRTGSFWPCQAETTAFPLHLLKITTLPTWGRESEGRERSGEGTG